MFVKKLYIDNSDNIKVYTSDNPDPSSSPPKKAPYVLFKLSNNQELIRKIENSNLFNLGWHKVENDQYSLLVTSSRKVIQAIDIFLKTFNIKKNDILFSTLDEYKIKCLAIQNKKTKAIPSKSKDISQFKIQKTLSQTSYKNLHIITSNSPSKKSYYYKENVVGRSISEIEAFNAFCYRVLLGERHPKIKGIHGNHGERKGIASEFIEFESLADYMNKPEYSKNKDFFSQNKDFLLKSEIVKVWVAAYTEEEDDLHGRNYGFSKAEYAVKIDDDHATYPLTSKYFCIEKPDVSSKFIVTKRDILNFPLIQDTIPDHWVTKVPCFSKKDLQWLASNEKFLEDKYYLFLKRILIPDHLYENFGRATIASTKTRNTYVAHKCKKTKELRKALLDIPDFQNYIINNRQKIITQLIAEFSEYNKDYKKEKDNYLKIDLKVIEENFGKINDEINNKNQINSKDVVLNLEKDEISNDVETKKLQAEFSEYKDYKKEKDNDLNLNVIEENFGKINDEINIKNQINSKDVVLNLEKDEIFNDVETKKLQAEFSEYNKDSKKEKDNDLNLNVIEENFGKINDEINIKNQINLKTTTEISEKEAIKLNTECERYCNYLENKLDLSEIKTKLKDFYKNHEEYEDKASQKDNLLNLINLLNSNDKKGFLNALYQQNKAFARINIIDKLFPNKKLIFIKLYNLYKAKEILKGPDPIQNFYNEFNQSIKNDLRQHPSKKEKNFIVKIGYILKKVILVPYTMYSKHSPYFWKSRAELLEAKLEKTMNNIKKSSLKDCNASKKHNKKS